jgi:hypothetical protein
MNDFNYNHSIIDEKYRIILSQDMINALRAQARVIIVPFFREICIRFENSEYGQLYPVLTSLCERIIENVFQVGEIDYESIEEANEVAMQFLAKLNSWQKTCLGIYFSSDMDFLEKLDLENGELDGNNELTIEEIYEHNGIKIKESVFKLAENDTEMASRLVNELIHIQDIFSTEDIGNWDASSIVYANENFEGYAGKGQILIPVQLDEYDYWEKIIDKEGEENEEEDEDEF